MNGYNKVLLMGNLTRDPETRYVPNGDAVCDFGLAMNESRTNAAGKLVENVTYVDVECWNRLAENVGKYKRKGDAVFIDGKLKLEQWEKDGQNRSKLKVTAFAVQFLRGEGKQDEGRDEEPRPAPSQRRRDPELSAKPQAEDDIPF